MTRGRRLIILRHAKSAWPDVPDHDRPLGARGLRDAPAAGRRLRDDGLLPDRVVCSTARRARETWGLAARELDAAPPPVCYEPRLYDATAPELLDVVRETPDEAGTLLLVGHNPGVQELAVRLAGDGVGDALPRLREKFPTCAMAVLTWEGPWSAAGFGAALLTCFAVPRVKQPKS